MALTRITRGVIKPNENYDTHNIVSTGIVTSVGLDVNGNADISGSLSVGGVLTYEDVTSIDSIGIITARTGLVSPYADIDDFVSVGSNIHLGNAGVVTATSFVGSGAALTGIDATAIKDSGGNVKVQAQASGAMYTGIHTFSSGAEVGSNIKLGNAGVITATSFVGSGAALTGIDATAVKDSGGNVKIQAQASGAVYTGIHTFGTNTNFTDIDVDGHTNLDNLNIAGVSTFAGTLNASTVSSTALIASGDLDVDGHTNLDNVSIAGVTTMSGNLTISNTAPVLKLVDTDNNSDFSIYGAAGVFNIYDETNSASRLTIASDGTITAIQGLVCSSTLTIPDSIIHSGDTNTKIRFPAADTFTVETAGSTRFGISSSGNIELHGTQTGNNVATIYNGTGALSFYASSNSGVNRDFRFFSSNSNSNEALRITSGGDVGVGNDSPNCRLAVKDVAEHTAYNSVTPNVTDAMLQLYNNPPNETANDHATIQFGVNGGSHNRVNSISAVAESAGNRKLAFTFCTDEAGSRTEKLRITGDGSLLVGKTVGTMATAGTRIDPQSTLITGSSTSTNLATASGAAIILVNNSATDNNFSNIGGYNSNSLVTSQINFVNTSHSSRTGDITFMTHNGSSMPERLRINKDGHTTPGSDAVYDLGSSSLRFRNVYTTDLQLSNVGGGGNEVDGTEGNWTLQEGDSNIYMINRKTGKKYKMMLQEVD